jgi:hypothetical protein
MRDAHPGNNNFANMPIVKQAQKDELTFPVDAIITDVVKMDGGWWKGSYGEKTGWLPSNYVKDVESGGGKDAEAEAKDTENADPLGVLQKSFLSVFGLHVEPRSVTSPPTLRVPVLISLPVGGAVEACGAREREREREAQGRRPPIGCMRSCRTGRICPAPFAFLQH